MNLDEMPAGREMDALVAEKVMGWTETNSAHGKMSGRPPEGNALYETVGNIVRKARVPKYSTDIATAWEVVTRMAVTFSLKCPSTASKSWYAQFGYRGDGAWYDEVMARANAPTAPLAICRAALKFMEYIESNDEH